MGKDGCGASAGADTTLGGIKDGGFIAEAWYACLESGIFGALFPIFMAACRNTIKVTEWHWKSNKPQWSHNYWMYKFLCRYHPNQDSQWFVREWKSPELRVSP